MVKLQDAKFVPLNPNLQTLGSKHDIRSRNFSNQGITPELGLPMIYGLMKFQLNSTEGKF